MAVMDHAIRGNITASIACDALATACVVGALYAWSRALGADEALAKSYIVGPVGLIGAGIASGVFVTAKKAIESMGATVARIGGLIGFEMSKFMAAKMMATSAAIIWAMVGE